MQSVFLKIATVCIRSCEITHVTKDAASDRPVSNTFDI